MSSVLFSLFFVNPEFIVHLGLFFNKTKEQNNKIYNIYKNLIWSKTWNPDMAGWMVRCERYKRLVPTDKVYRKYPFTLTCAAAIKLFPVKRTKTTCKTKMICRNIWMDTLVDTIFFVYIIQHQTFLLPTVIRLTVGLEFIWENRKNRKPTPVLRMRAELEAAISIRRRSRLRRVREAGKIMENIINNFFW